MRSDEQQLRDLIVNLYWLCCRNHVDHYHELIKNKEVGVSEELLAEIRLLRRMPKHHMSEF